MADGTGCGLCRHSQNRDTQRLQKARNSRQFFEKEPRIWAENMEPGVIRIDTHPDNRIMQNWLKKNGFSYCGWIWLVTGDLRYAYEKLL